jgi:F0F1-type ATP synthase membrane subunit b/b'
MSTNDPNAAQSSLTSLPRLEDLPRAGEGYAADAVQSAFDAFRRHTSQLQAQLRVLQAAGRSSQVEPTGHAVRMDALHLIRAASEFADTIERDAQTASAAQIQRTEEEVRHKQNELQAREAEVERYRTESERQRAEMLNAARNEARDLLAKAHADATREVQEAEARGNRMLEQSRHQATELTNAARAEVEQTLEWARAQATAILARAQHGAEQLLAAAGLGEDAISQVANAIVRAAEQVGERPVAAAFAGPAAVPEPDRDEPEVEQPQAEEESSEEQAPPPPPPQAAPPPPLTTPPSEGDGERPEPDS